MPKKDTYGAEEARTYFPNLLERAHCGERIVITKHGKPYAELVQLGAQPAAKPRTAFLLLAGSGSGLWGHDTRETIERMRNESD